MLNLNLFKAYIIRPTGTIEEVEPRNGEYFSLQELNNIVNGYIEIVRFRDGRIMIVNEEGCYLNLAENMTATELALANSGISRDDTILGNALVCPMTMVR